MPRYVASIHQPDSTYFGGTVRHEMDEVVDDKNYITERWGPAEIYVYTFGRWWPVDEDAFW